MPELIPATIQSEEPVYNNDPGAPGRIFIKDGYFYAFIEGVGWARGTMTTLPAPASIGALNFSGGGYVSMSGLSSYAWPANFTIEMFVKGGPSSGNGNLAWTGANAGQSGPQGFYVAAQDGGDSRACGQFIAWDGSGHFSSYSPGLVVNDSAWHHIACTYDGSSMQRFSDGTRITNDSVAGSIGTTANPFYLNNGATAFTGLMTGVRISNTVRYGAGGYTPSWATNTTVDGNTIACWKMTDGEGTTVTDAGGSYDGTINGTVTWSTDTSGIPA